MSLTKSVVAAVLLAGAGLCSPSIGAESYSAAKEVKENPGKIS